MASDLCILSGKIIALDGLPGVGKTTFGHFLYEYLNKIGIQCIFLSEYVNQELLELYLSDLNKYSLMFQIAMLKEKSMTYHVATKEAAEGKFVIIDRSHIGDSSFALMQKSKYKWTKKECSTYDSIFNELNMPTCIINLDSSVSTAFARMLERQRPGEISAYTTEYYDKLKLNQDNQLHKYATDIVLVFDWNDRDINDNCCQQILEQLADFLADIQ